MEKRFYHLKNYLSFLSSTEGDPFEIELNWRLINEINKKKAPVLTFKGTLNQHFNEFCELNETKGYGVHLLINSNDGKGTKEANIVGIKALFVDSDGTHIDFVKKLTANDFAVPSFINFRSNTHWHAYYVLDEISRNKTHLFSETQRLLTSYLTPDKPDFGVCSLATLMRVPSFFYTKNTDKIFYKFYNPSVNKNKLVKHSIENIKNLSVSNNRKNTSLDSPIDVENFEGLLSLCDGAVEGAFGDKTTYSMACKAKEYNLSEKKAFELLQVWNEKCSPPWEIDELKKKIENAYQYSTNTPTITTQNSITDTLSVSEEYQTFLVKNLRKTVQKKAGCPYITILQNDFNIKLIFEHDPDYKDLFSFNEFSGTVVMKRCPFWLKPESFKGAYEHVVSDDDLKAVIFYLSVSNFYRLTVTLERMDRCVLCVAKHDSFHPVKSHLESLVWDGVKRIDNWIETYLGYYNPAYTHIIAPKIFIALVARIYEPGCKFDHMIVLEGLTGIRKTELLKIIGGRWYYSGAAFDMEKPDVHFQLAGYWVIELSELDTLKKSDIRTVKSFLTQDFAKVRKSYGRMHSLIDRKYVFFGTTNDTSYLTDLTGNRRFWPIRVTEIAIDKFKRDRDQLFAEACVRYKNKERTYLTSEEDKIADEVRAINLEVDVWVEVIQIWLQKASKTRITLLEIWRQCFLKEESSFHHSFQIRISKALKFLGFEKKRNARTKSYFYEKI